MATVAQATSTVRLPRLGRRAGAVAVVAAWIVLYFLTRGHNTLGLAQTDTNALHRRLNDLNANIGANRDSNPLFTYFFNPIREAIQNFVTFLQHLISQPVGDRPVPYVGWLGVLAIVGFIAWTFGSFRVAVLAVVGFFFLGLQGLWTESMDTLVLTIAAVLIALAIGIPLGVWAGVSNKVNAVITPVLDFMQTMPTYVYLAPLALVFQIGVAAATIATLVYAVPPVIRLTAHGIRSIPGDTREAMESLGTTKGQALRKVLLPMAKETIVIGINQTMMAALSMATIAALISAPGLGQTVVQAIPSLDVGTAFNAGLAIVVLAIVLDRVTTTASKRAEKVRRANNAEAARLRRPAIAVGAVVTAVLVWLSYTYQLVAIFPDHLKIHHWRMSWDAGSHIKSAANSASNWVTDHLSAQTQAIKDAVTVHALQPLQTLLDNSPWWLTFAAILALAMLAGGVRALIPAALCLGLIIATGLWEDSMDTLAQTLVGTVIVMVLAVIVGIWMGRNRHADRVIRPVLDALQTMPSFVYLVPFLALFLAGRFTAVIAAVLYAVPVATKIVADGIRAVNPATVEAATSAGSNTWQIITKVQLPMAMRTLVLATNQGLIYVLAMVVVGGLVGGGALGYDVVAGFKQLDVFGKGLAAGLAIVLLGIMLDRITTAAARRSTVSAGHGH